MDCSEMFCECGGEEVWFYFKSHCVKFWAGLSHMEYYGLVFLSNEFLCNFVIIHACNSHEPIIPIKHVKIIKI